MVNHHCNANGNGNGEDVTYRSNVLSETHRPLHRRSRRRRDTEQSHYNSEDSVRLMRQIQALSQLQHENLVQLIGMVSSPLMLVCEFVQHGALDAFLKVLSFLKFY